MFGYAFCGSDTVTLFTKEGGDIPGPSSRLRGLWAEGSIEAAKAFASLGQAGRDRLQEPRRARRDTGALPAEVAA